MSRNAHLTLAVAGILAACGPAQPPRTGTTTTPPVDTADTAVPGIPHVDCVYDRVEAVEPFDSLPAATALREALAREYAATATWTQTDDGIGDPETTTWRVAFDPSSLPTTVESVRYNLDVAASNPSHLATGWCLEHVYWRIPVTLATFETTDGALSASGSLTGRCSGNPDPFQEPIDDEFPTGLCTSTVWFEGEVQLDASRHGDAVPPFDAEVRIGIGPTVAPDWRGSVYSRMDHALRLTTE